MGAQETIRLSLLMVRDRAKVSEILLMIQSGIIKETDCMLKAFRPPDYHLVLSPPKCDYAVTMLMHLDSSQICG